MSTIQIAQRLVRTFGEGDKLKKVITETIGEGKTLTKVLDNEGKVIQERLKVIAPQEQVGDKFVSTTTKVLRYEDGQVEKTVLDRVYQPTAWKGGVSFDDEAEIADAGMECIGKKKIGERLKKWINGILDRKVVQTQDKRLITEFNESKNGKIREVMKKDKDFVIGEDGEMTFLRHSMNCNDKGLPMPHKFLSFGIKDTLRDMRIAFQKQYPGSRYAPSNFSFSSLDEHLPDMKLTDLDKYL